MLRVYPLRKTSASRFAHTLKTRYLESIEPVSQDRSLRGQESRWQSLRAAYMAALVLPWVITAFRFGIREYAGDKSHLVFYTLPVVIAATIGGFWPGVVASLLGLTLGVYYILPPERSFWIPDISSWISVVGIGSIWLFVSWVSNVLLVKRQQASDALAASEDAQRQLEQAQLALLAEERARRNSAEQESKRKDEFVATLSHELRTPLTSIIGWTEILKTQATDEKVLDGMEAIEKAARQQAHLVEDLLDMSRIVTGQLKMHMEIIDLQESIADVIGAHEAMAIQQGKHILGPRDGEPCFVRGDALRLIQIFSNLVSNSLKYSEEGSEIRISIREVGERVEVAVQDNGIGIPADQLAHIFDRFRQISGPGTPRQAGLGLGLSIVDQLVAEHGGSVRAESPGPGRGTTVTVTLPIAHPQLQPS
ncbi:MAG: HAMP domain-containing histidine kinase [Armatimonadetes bacterium]|nr:HAMP domain-containing histidine kinase [Armatimonadota bacterium]